MKQTLKQRGESDRQMRKHIKEAKEEAARKKIAQEKYEADAAKPPRIVKRGPKIVGKRVQFDDETWAAIEAAASESGRSFQEIADEAFADFLKKHKQPVGLERFPS